MRVKCRSCGRKFDYEGCGGMCPKCTSYYQIDYKPEEDMLGERFESRDEYADDEQEVSSSYSYTGYEEGQDSVHRKKGNAYTWCMVILIIVVMVMPFLIARVANTADVQYEEEAVLEDDGQQVIEQNMKQITSLNVGDAFPYEAVDNYNYEGKEERIPYSIRITGAKADEEFENRIPKGYELLAVSYEITPEEAQEENSGEDKSSDRVYSIYTNTYLLTKSGQYLYPLETYQMEELLGCEREELEKRGIDSEFCYSEGLFYFMVKQGDAAGLRVFCQKYDYENYQMEGIFAGYEILGLGGGNDE